MLLDLHKNLPEFALTDELLNAEKVLTDLAGAFWSNEFLTEIVPHFFERRKVKLFESSEDRPDLPSRYKILVEQIPAIVFMAYFDRGISEAYVSPQIEAMLGFKQEEWLEDPVRWYNQIHPEDKARWSIEAAQTFVSGETLRSIYRVISRDNRTVWFKCEVRMVRREDGRPWFIHGVGFDITELKQVEHSLKKVSLELQQQNEELRQEIAERKRAQLMLREYAEQQKILSRRLLAVQEAERRHLALELHDEIGQTLTGLKLTLEMCARQSANQQITGAQALVNDLIAKVRQLSLDLRPATLDHLGLLSAIFGLIRNYTEQTGIAVDFKHDKISGRRFVSEIEISVYRVIQEALTNAARHAKVRKIRVRLWASTSNLHLTIEDKGVGFDLQKALTANNSTGVAGMRERVLFLNGVFNLESAPGKGTKINAHWILNEKKESA